MEPQEEGSRGEAGRRRRNAVWASSLSLSLPELIRVGERAQTRQTQEGMQGQITQGWAQRTHPCAHTRVLRQAPKASNRRVHSQSCTHRTGACRDADSLATNVQTVYVFTYTTAKMKDTTSTRANTSIDTQACGMSPR